ncbi:MAG: hypothetical protein ACRD1K_12955 [Acidimicrobiales bacterium]
MAAVLGLVILLTASQPLDSTNASTFSWRTGDTGCSTANSADSASHGFYYDPGLTGNMAAATNWARSNVIDPTDINTFDVGTVAFDTDVVVYDQDYTTYCGYSWHSPGGSGVVGLNKCVLLATNPANACEKNEIRYDESFTNSTTSDNRNGLACHENGHALGLAHVSSGSCMVTFYPKPLGYSAHEVFDHINAMY